MDVGSTQNVCVLSNDDDDESSGGEDEHEQDILGEEEDEGKELCIQVHAVVDVYK